MTFIESQVASVKTRFTTAYMIDNKAIHQLPAHTMDYKRICKKLKVDYPETVVKKLALWFSHKVVFTKKPKNTYNIFTKYTHPRACQMHNLETKGRTNTGSRC